MQTLTKEDLDENATANLLYARKQLGLSQQKFADALDINMKTIGAIEENRVVPSPHLIYKLSKLIKVSISTLYTEQLANQNQ